MRAKPRQVWECVTCGWRYAAPINHTMVLCPHDHLKKTRMAHVIWDKKTDGGEPPPLTKGDQ